MSQNINSSFNPGAFLHYKVFVKLAVWALIMRSWICELQWGNRIFAVQLKQLFRIVWPCREFASRLLTKNTFIIWRSLYVSAVRVQFLYSTVRVAS